MVTKELACSTFDIADNQKECDSSHLMTYKASFIYIYIFSTIRNKSVHVVRQEAFSCSLGAIYILFLLEIIMCVLSSAVYRITIL